MNEVSVLNKQLHDSWHNCDSVKPFMKTLVNLIEDNKLSSFDLSFWSNWIGKKEKGRFFQSR